MKDAVLVFIFATMIGVGTAFGAGVGMYFGVRYTGAYIVPAVGGVAPAPALGDCEDLLP